MLHNDKGKMTNESVKQRQWGGFGDEVEKETVPFESSLWPGGNTQGFAVEFCRDIYGSLPQNNVFMCGGRRPVGHKDTQQRSSSQQLNKC